MHGSGVVTIFVILFVVFILFRITTRARRTGRMRSGGYGWRPDGSDPQGPDLPYGSSDGGFGGGPDGGDLGGGHHGGDMGGGHHGGDMGGGWSGGGGDFGGGGGHHG